MEDYPSIPLYRGEDISVLKRVVDPKLCIVLPLALWENESFKRLPDGAKLLYGIIVSKLASGDVVKGQGGQDCVRLPVKRIKELQGCSKRSAQWYLNELYDSGLIAREKVGGHKGKGIKTILYPQIKTDMTGTAIIVIPISLFSCEKFVKLPDGAKLMYGQIFANMANDDGFTDPLGNYYQFLPMDRIIAYCMITRRTLDKYMHILIASGLIVKLQLNAKGKRGKIINLLYIGRLV